MRFAPLAAILLGSALAPVYLRAAEMPVGFFRGKFVGWDGTATQGNVSAVDAKGDVFSCGFNKLSYMDRDHAQVPLAKVERGEQVEILADRVAGRCYVRLAHFADTLPKDRSKPIPTLPSWLGDRTLAGIVIRRNPVMLTLRTSQGVRTVSLRSDTLFFVDGFRVAEDDIAINSRVFIRASRASDGHIEAYEIATGSLGGP